MPEHEIVNYSQAVCLATKEAMREDDTVIVLGEGVTDPKAIFGTTEGLFAEFGEDHVIETPVAENGLTGIAIGAAMSGLRPVIIHQRVEFALLSLEQIVNNAAKTHYVTNGALKVPLVIRLIVGRGWGQGPMHSQSLESIFAHIPGLKVIMPSTASDAYHMLKAAIKDDSPVVMVEHRWLHYVTGTLDHDSDTSSRKLEEGYGSKIRRPGKDLTLASYSYPTLEAIQAAEVVAQFDVDCELIEIPVLKPLSTTALKTSVKKTGHLVTIDMGWVHYGIGSELISQICEEDINLLTSNPIRLGLADHPTPSSRSLADAYYPNCVDILTAISKSLNLSNTVLSSMLDYWEKIRPDTPIDVPNPNFKGPF